MMKHSSDSLNEFKENLNLEFQEFKIEIKELLKG
jgi:hypothetical protein